MQDTYAPVINGRRVARVRGVTLSILLAVSLMRAPSLSRAQDSEPLVPTPGVDCQAPVVNETLASGPETAPGICWSVDFSSFTTRPAVSGDTVFFGSANSLSRPALFALDATTGAERWNFELGERFFASEPIVVGDRVFAGGPDGLYRLDAATGQRDWRFRVEPDEMGLPRSFMMPAHHDGRVYGVSGGIIGGILWAVDAETGEELWNLDEPETGFFAPVATDAGVLTVTYGGRLRLLDPATGEALWTVELGQQPPGPATVIGDLAIAATYEGAVAFDLATGAPDWTYTSETGATQVVAAGEQLLVVEEGSLAMLDPADASEVWRAEFAVSPTPGLLGLTLPVVAGTTIYVVMSDGLEGTIVALDTATGETRWSIGSAEGLLVTYLSTPAAGGGRLYVGGFSFRGQAFSLGTT